MAKGKHQRTTTALALADAMAEIDRLNAEVAALRTVADTTAKVAQVEAQLKVLTARNLTLEKAESERARLTRMVETLTAKLEELTAQETKAKDVHKRVFEALMRHAPHDNEADRMLWAIDQFEPDQKHTVITQGVTEHLHRVIGGRPIETVPPALLKRLGIAYTP